MIVRANTHDHPTVLTTVLLLCAIALLALLPRLLGLADFFTYDEAYHWVGRTERFSQAVLTHDWLQTRQTGHPGVTLMWLGSLGLLLEHATSVTHVTSQIDHLAWMRFPVALVHSLVVPAGYLLLRRLVLPFTALLAAILWATSPFLIAHGRLLHMDALLTDFVTYSLLLTMIACRADYHKGWLVGAGIFAGFALLTKGPSLILLPMIGLVLLWYAPRGSKSAYVLLRLVITTYFFWLGIAVATVFLAWPALWVDPGFVITRYFDKVVGEGNNPFGNAQFFFGETVSDPGLLFYPVVYLFRTNPITLIGLLLLPLAVRHSPQERDVRIMLSAWVIFWTIMMSMGAKKFDRYILPVMPALQVLAAIGWSALLLRNKKEPQLLENGLLPTPSHSWLRFVPPFIAILLLAVNIQSIIAYHPYYLSYYNPLVGGGRVAQRMLLIGWGEGMDQVGAFLRQRPDIEQSVILATDTRLLEPFVSATVKQIDEIDKVRATYAVLDLPSHQRRISPEIFARIAQTMPLHRITIQGIEYAAIYQLPKPFDHAVQGCFGDTVCLHGVTIVQHPEQIIITPSWDVRQVPHKDYWVFLRLIDSNGQTVAQTDTSPGGDEQAHTSTWQTGAQIAVPLPLHIPSNLPAGEYDVVLGWYDVSSGERLVLTKGVAADPAHAGLQALFVKKIFVQTWD